MSVQTQLDRLRIAIANAFTACSGKGATIPNDQIIENLPDCIESINIASGDTQGGATSIVLQSKSVTPTESVQVVEADSGYNGLSDVQVGAISNTYIGSAVTRKEAASYTPTKDEQIIEQGQYLNGAQVINPIPDNYIDTSEGDADIYDICKGKIAFVNGVKVEGDYMATPAGGSQYNCNSTNCSADTLKIPCLFEPRYCCVISNSGTQVTNTVIAAMFMPGGVTYHGRTSSGVGRPQYTSNLSDYWYYDSTNKLLVLNKPYSLYTWSSYNYRIFAFK